MIEKLTEYLNLEDDVRIVSGLVEVDRLIKGVIELTVETAVLRFEICFLPSYPFEFHNSESIRFINQELLEYDHVNADGSICIHTHHSASVEKKIWYDIASLKEWVKKYYLGKAVEKHYEHILLPPTTNSTFLFTDVDCDFKFGDYGTFEYSKLGFGQWDEGKLQTFIVQGFNLKNVKYQSTWTQFYRSAPVHIGLFVFLNDAPVENRRFGIRSWRQLENFVSIDFFDFLNKKKLEIQRSGKDVRLLPLLIGYRTPNEGRLHWQVVFINTPIFPQEILRIANSREVLNKFKDFPIEWGQTRNCSYDLFFGRGCLNEKLTGSKILIIGIGAVGSQLAKSLARGGSRNISISDYDIKEPENVCRSEYVFHSGLTSKTEELSLLLNSISPFVQVAQSELLGDLAKVNYSSNDFKIQFTNYLDTFDFVFNCSADDDLTFILDTTDTKSNVLNISITNHARELVCACKPNMYEFVRQKFEELNEKNDDKSFNPPGCWSSTFLASYNDIAVLVQFALKQINLSLEASIELRNFIISTSAENEFKLELKQY